MEISDRNREKCEEVLHLEYIPSKDSDGESEFALYGPDVRESHKI